MQITCKCAKLRTYENLGISYIVSSKADYVGVPLRSLRGDVEKPHTSIICSLDLKTYPGCAMWPVADEF